MLSHHHITTLVQAIARRRQLLSSNQRAKEKEQGTDTYTDKVMESNARILSLPHEKGQSNDKLKTPLPEPVGKLLVSLKLVRKVSLCKYSGRSRAKKGTVLHNSDLGWEFYVFTAQGDGREKASLSAGSNNCETTFSRNPTLGHEKVQFGTA